MKILFVIKGLSKVTGGAERVFCQLAGLLKNAGNDIVIASFDIPESCSFYPIDSRIRHYQLGVGDTAQRSGVVEFVKKVYMLHRLVKKIGPRVAVGFMHSSYIPLALSCLYQDIKVVASEHTVPEYYQNRKLEYFLILSLSPLYTKVTVPSESVKSLFPWVLRRKMTSLPNPVGFIDPVSKPNDKDRPFTILSIGRLTAMKRQGYLVKAFHRICVKFPNLHLRIVGDGEARNDLLELISNLNLSRCVHVIPPTKNVSDEYNRADIFVLPSQFESFGLVAIEAMSASLPVVIYEDCKVVAEMIQDGVNGFVVKSEPDPISNLATKLEFLINNQELISQVGDSSRLMVCKRFSGEDICSQWQQMFNNC